MRTPSSEKSWNGSVKHISGVFVGLGSPSSVKEWRALGGSNARWITGSNGGMSDSLFLSSGSV